jgi:hypothetical protein
MPSAQKVVLVNEFEPSFFGGVEMPKQKFPQKCEGVDGSSCGYEWLSRVEFPKRCPLCLKYQKKFVEHFYAKQAKKSEQ